MSFLEEMKNIIGDVFGDGSERDELVEIMEDIDELEDEAGE